MKLTFNNTKLNPTVIESFQDLTESEPLYSEPIWTGTDPIPTSIMTSTQNTNTNTNTEGRTDSNGTNTNTNTNTLADQVKNELGVTGDCVGVMVNGETTEPICKSATSGKTCGSVKLDDYRVCRWTDNNLFDETIPYVIQISGLDSPGDGLADLCMQAVGGSGQGNNINISSGFSWNKTKPNGTFFIKQAGISEDDEPYYSIQVSGQTSPGDGQVDLCLNAMTPIQGTNISLFQALVFNINLPTGTFFIKEVGSSDDGTPYYVIQVSGQTTPGDGLADLCLHADGGSYKGNNIKLHGGVDYNTNNPNGTFFIIPVEEGFQNKKENKIKTKTKTKTKEHVHFTQILKYFAICVAVFIVLYLVNKFIHRIKI
jgi:hypothetical protein